MNYVRKTYSQIRMQHLMQLFLQLIFPMTMHIDKFKCFKYEATHTPKYTDMHHIIFHIYTFFVILNENKESLCLSGGAECLYFCECTNSKLVSPWWFISLSISGSRGAEKDLYHDFGTRVITFIFMMLRNRYIQLLVTDGPTFPYDHVFFV